MTPGRWFYLDVVSRRPVEVRLDRSIPAGHKSAVQRVLDRIRFPVIGLMHCLAPGWLPSRKILPFYLNRRGLVGEGAEIGVLRGVFSEHLLRYWRGRCLHCIDPWTYLGTLKYDEPKDAAGVPEREFHETCYRETIWRLKPFGGRAHILRATSREAAASFADGSLDFAFIDARHDYEAVKEDISLWYPKIRDGGILCGHDWSLDYGPPHYGVKKAVMEYVKACGCELLVSADQESWFTPVCRRDS